MIALLLTVRVVCEALSLAVYVCWYIESIVYGIQSLCPIIRTITIFSIEKHEFKTDSLCECRQRLSWPNNSAFVNYTDTQNWFEKTQNIKIMNAQPELLAHSMFTYAGPKWIWTRDEKRKKEKKL